MTAVRRSLTLLVLTLGVVVGGTVNAAATYSDTASVSPTIGTYTVPAPTGLVVDDSCTTTTTTVKRTVYTHPGTGATSTTAYSSVTTAEPSSSNVQGTTTSTQAGPRPNETTTTTVTKNTELRVTLSWTGTTARGLSGYVVSAELGDGSRTPMLSTGTAATSATQVQDADVLGYQPKLLVSSQTTYGWTGDSLRTRVLSC